MGGIKILHAADLHLGSPFKGLAGEGELPPLFADCTFRAFTRLIDLALAEQVQAVVLAGDLYDQKDRSLRARLHLRSGLQRLEAVKIPTFIVHGNHDPLDADPGGLSLPPGVKVFGSSWEEVDAGAFCIQGVSFPTTEVKQNLASAFARRSEKPTIGLLHCNLGGHAGHSNYAPCTLEDLERAGLDYWALGHVHTRAQFPLGNHGLAAYPGNLQGRHVNETGERGVLLVTLDPSRQVAPAARFVPLDTVRWHRLEVAIDQLETVDALLDRCEAAIRKAAVGLEGDVVRLQLSGRGALHSHLESAAKLLELEAALRARFEATPVLLESLRDASTPAWELERVIASGGLVSEVALRLRAPPAPREVDELWAHAGLEALDAALIEAGLPALKSGAELLLHEAATRAVDLLEGDA
jgi:exonuclease SbcD